jgi:hypothetical protein
LTGADQNESALFLHGTASCDSLFRRKRDVAVIVFPSFALHKNASIFVRGAGHAAFLKIENAPAARENPSVSLRSTAPLSGPASLGRFSRAQFPLARGWGAEWFVTPQFNFYP